MGQVHALRKAIKLVLKAAAAWMGSISRLGGEVALLQLSKRLRHLRRDILAFNALDLQQQWRNLRSGTQ